MQFAGAFADPPLLSRNPPLLPRPAHFFWRLAVVAALFAVCYPTKQPTLPLTSKAGKPASWVSPSPSPSVPVPPAGVTAAFSFLQQPLKLYGLLLNSFLHLDRSFFPYLLGFCDPQPHGWQARDGNRAERRARAWTASAASKPADVPRRDPIAMQLTLINVAERRPQAR
jgi:hypothetical protein